MVKTLMLVMLMGGCFTDDGGSSPDAGPDAFVPRDAPAMTKCSELGCDETKLNNPDCLATGAQCRCDLDGPNGPEPVFTCYPG